MTRITNIGRKRTYIEAGFGSADVDEGQHKSQSEAILNPESGAGNLPKKPRKRRRKKTNVAVHGEEPINTDQDRTIVEGGKQAMPRRVRSGEKHMGDEEYTKVAASERRRLNRISERLSSMTCLACRKKGHTVKDCPEARTALHEDDGGSTGAPGTSTVGICYRCGSRRHNLSRCKKLVNSKDPLPFASCFVCSGKGHLASSCPQNQGKGIYPNGGSCMLCGQTSHLAKDCELRTQDVASKSAIMLGGTQNEGGADEDDFHVLKRRRDAVKKEDAIIQRTAIQSAEMVVKAKPKVVVFK